MIEIKNKNKSPISVIVRSKKAPRAFTTLVIPGIGAGKNVRRIPDEMTTEYVERLEKSGLISTRYIPNNEVEKGE
jgi:hypothetical protein